MRKIGHIVLLYGSILKEIGQKYHYNEFKLKVKGKS